MEKIITLYGRGEIGKTETLNLFIDLLEVATTGCQMPTPQKIGFDRKVTFNYKGKIVSICTAGDNANELNDNREYFIERKCEISISASRTRGKTVEILNELASANSLSLIKYKKIIDYKDRVAVNKKQAEQLMNSL